MLTAICWLRRSAAAAVAATAVFAHASVCDAGLFALSSFSGPSRLSSVSHTTGAASFIGNTDFIQGYGLAGYNGQLYSYDQNSDTIKQLNTTTAGTVTAISFGADLVGEGSIEFRSDGVGFISTASGPNGTGLWTFSLAPNSGTFVANTSQVLDGIDFQPGTDVLFGLTQSTNDLYTVNQVTGALTLVGDPGIPSGVLAGLAFAPNGTLYAMNIFGDLYSLNTTNASATFIGNSGLTDVSGLAWVEDQVQEVPEPASLALLAIGSCVAGAGASLRRRRAAI